MTSLDNFIDCYFANLQRKLHSSLKFFPNDWDEEHICAVAMIMILHNHRNLNHITDIVRSSLAYGYLDI
ncbi:hypothetical protein [Candidatus Uabimicrobium sp. HlEnr_7]|uniref:hypothetical protein n=1 Tax=Candidatus Uabimicrobium helgolandensis TaxID=3095367 RepID=UPI003557049D